MTIETIGALEIGNTVTIDLPNPLNRFNKYSYYQQLVLEKQTDNAFLFRLGKTNYTLWLPKKAIIQCGDNIHTFNDKTVIVKVYKLAHWFTISDYARKVLYQLGHAVYSYA